LKKGTNALGTQNPQATLRGLIYIACAVGILSCMALMGYDALTGNLSREHRDFVFWAEAGGLWSFGLSWLTASHVLPVVNRAEERFKPLSSRKEQPSPELAGSVRPI
jgi:hypothetical protein